MNDITEWDAYAAHCPTRMVLDRIADKWSVLILGLLIKQPLRFNMLLKKIEGLSQKVLSQTLKRLERDGLIHRQAFATVPVTVEYTATPLGMTLATSLLNLINWAEKNMCTVMSAQQAYDAAAKN
jgi:DNA-binding HxlR family transcriptional regulator